MSRPSFPAPIGVTLALQLEGEPHEAEGTHALSVEMVRDQGDEQLARINLAWEGAGLPERFNTHIPLTLAMAVPLAAFIIPGPGNYVLQISVDEDVQRVIRFAAEATPQLGSETAEA